MLSSGRFLIALLMMTASGVASAHPGHDVSGFAAGILHPFSGFDHLLAMVAVGIWAAQGGGRKIWLLPATFMTMLAVGATTAMVWPALPMVETGIASSVLALGLLITLSLQFPAILSVAVTALFGFFHGYAHGLELPESVSPATYALGFLIATASLHLIGISIGIATHRRHAGLAKALGFGIALSGIYLLATT